MYFDYPNGEGAYHEKPENRVSMKPRPAISTYPGVELVGLPKGPPVVPVSAHIIESYVPNPPNQAQPVPNFSNTSQVDRWMLYVWYDRLPELRGMVETQISDVFGEGYELDGDEAKVKKALRFCKANRFTTSTKAILRDRFIGGDGYMGKAAVSQEQVLNLIDSVHSDVLQKSASPAKRFMLLNKIRGAKPDLYSVKSIFPIGARYMKINYGPHGEILGYIQTPYASTNVVMDYMNTNNQDQVPASSATPQSLFYPIQFRPDEIIHFANDPVGDAIYGTSNIQTALLDIAALFYAKNYGGVFFQNDATPNYMYTMPNESPDSRNYKNFLEQLKTYKQNPHRSMVITGNVEVERVSADNKDIQFGEFMDKYLQRILMGAGMTSRYSHLFNNGKLETPPNLEPYYKRINGIQQDIEEVLNDELFDHMGVEFSFKRVYKRDETREADIVSKLIHSVISVNEAREYLGYKKIPGKEYDFINPNGVNQQSGKMNEVQSADARTEQNANESTGPGNPSETNDSNEDDEDE